MPFLFLIIALSPLHADEFDEIHARLAEPPVARDVLESAMRRALAIELPPFAIESDEFIGLRWALAPALRRYLHDASITTKDDLRRLGMAIALAERLRILDDATVDAVLRFHHARLSRWTRLTRWRWTRDYDAVKKISLEAVRTMSSHRDRTRTTIFADPNWNERMSEPCAVRLLAHRK